MPTLSNRSSYTASLAGWYPPIDSSPWYMYAFELNSSPSGRMRKGGGRLLRNRIAGVSG